MYVYSLSAHGLPALFHLEEPVLDGFSERERRLLVGALNFHALMAPGRTLDIHLYDDASSSTPRTTDDTTFSGLSRKNRTRIRTFAVTSVLPPVDGASESGSAEANELVGRPSRHLHIPRDNVLQNDPVRPARTDLVGRIARRVKAQAPLMYDELRDLVLLRDVLRLGRQAERQDYDRSFEHGGSHAGESIRTAPPAAAEAPKAVIIGLHWFELGGAERWAFETVRLVRQAGFLPIVLTNRDSQHPWITRSELDGALLIAFSEPTVASQTPGAEPLLRALLHSFDVRGVVVHHNQWLYDRLAWIRRSRPELPIVDSTHIVEYRGGGYPFSSAQVTENITRHHVISPALKAWMVDVQGIAPEKVVMAPLVGLTSVKDEPVYRSRQPGEAFTVSFIGRMTRQKAPEVFAAMVKQIRDTHRDARFIMHGDGELSSWVDDVIRMMGLTDVILRRTSAEPVEETLRESHLLVVSSHNEGLTLTTLEAIAMGVPVVSTDVGAQSDLVPKSALVPRYAHPAARGLARTVTRIMDDEPAREELWNHERKAEERLLANTSATDWFSEEVRAW